MNIQTKIVSAALVPTGVDAMIEGIKGILQLGLEIGNEVPRQANTTARQPTREARRHDSGRIKVSEKKLPIVRQMEALEQKKKALEKFYDKKLDEWRSEVQNRRNYRNKELYENRIKSLKCLLKKEASSLKEDSSIANFVADWDKKIVDNGIDVHVWSGPCGCCFYPDVVVFKDYNESDIVKAAGVRDCYNPKKVVCCKVEDCCGSSRFLVIDVALCWAQGMACCCFRLDCKDNCICGCACNLVRSVSSFWRPENPYPLRLLGPDSTITDLYPKNNEAMRIYANLQLDPCCNTCSFVVWPVCLVICCVVIIRRQSLYDSLYDLYSEGEW